MASFAPPKASFSHQLDKFIRATAETEIHPDGSCNMGNVSVAVVEDQQSVHGIAILLAVDAYIMQISDVPT